MELGCCPMPVTEFCDIALGILLRVFPAFENLLPAMVSGLIIRRRGLEVPISPGILVTGTEL